MNLLLTVQSPSVWLCQSGYADQSMPLAGHVPAACKSQIHNRCFLHITLFNVFHASFSKSQSTKKQTAWDQGQTDHINLMLDLTLSPLQAYLHAKVQCQRSASSKDRVETKGKRMEVIK